MEPRAVTLVVPCYNVESTVSRCLSAIDRLDPSPREVVCIDDGSTDETAEVIRSRDDVTIIQHDRNQGLGATLNTALEYTETPGLAKVDGDILVEPYWLGWLCEAMKESKAALVQGRFEERITTNADKWRERHLDPSFPDEAMYWPVNGSNVLCRTAALRDVGGWDPRYRRAFDDIDLMRRLIREGHRVYYTPKVVATHIRTDTWVDVLRTAWAYHRNPFLPNRPPSRFRQVLIRAPVMFAGSLIDVINDLEHRAFSLLWLSLLRPLFHLKWDLEHAYAADYEPLDCMQLDRIEHEGIVIDPQDECVTKWTRRLLCSGRYETEETELVDRYIEPETDVIELGGGIGYLACYIDRLLDGTRTQVVVEPQERLVSVIEHHQELNGSTFELINAAYSAHGGQSALSVPVDPLRASTYRNGDDDTVIQPESVSLRTILDRFDLDGVTLVSDMEGCEYDLIDNELDVLESCCDLLIVEFHPELLPAEERTQQQLTSSFELIDQRGSVFVYRSGST